AHYPVRPGLRRPRPPAGHPGKGGADLRSGVAQDQIIDNTLREKPQSKTPNRSGSCLAALRVCLHLRKTVLDPSVAISQTEKQALTSGRSFIEWHFSNSAV